MGTVNVFTRYAQEENHFTNGLFSLLRLSTFDGPQFVNAFLSELLSLVPTEGIDGFRVLQGIDGTADAELSGKDCCCRFETKIVSGSLREDQVNDHLEHLERLDASIGLKKLVLLTPDDGKSKYIEDFIENFRPKYPEHILHLEWRRVVTFLKASIDNGGALFSELVRDFLVRINRCIIEQDIAGIIAKIDFGEKSSVFEDTYLAELQNGKWTEWNTPREYKNLDGKGRKLMLYDRTRKAITVEVEIQKVSRTDSEPDYPWTNLFVPGKLRVFEEPIPLNVIRAIPGFQSFGVHRKDRSPYRNITQEQYMQLMGHCANDK